jgi:hypothetical protein
MSSDLDLIYGTQAKSPPPADGGKETGGKARRPTKKQPPVSVKPAIQKPHKEESQPRSDTVIPRHHDTMQPRNHDTTIPPNGEGILERNRSPLQPS